MWLFYKSPTIFEVKRKGARDDVLTSNILSGDFSMLGWVGPDSRSIESSSGDVS